MTTGQCTLKINGKRRSKSKAAAMIYYTETEQTSIINISL